MTSSLLDNGLHYGQVTRALHWSMAAIFFWQFLGLCLEAVIGETPFVDALNSTHGSLGAILFVLAVVRAFWGLYNLKGRPPHERGLLGFAARAGHLALHLLMLVVPTLALLRSYGSGRGLAVFGLQVIPSGAERTEWMIAPARLLHGTLAWTLLAMIAGHILMVIIHRHVWKDDVLNRMAGRPLSPAE